MNSNKNKKTIKILTSIFICLNFTITSGVSEASAIKASNAAAILEHQMLDANVPPVSFWYAVGKCETTTIKKGKVLYGPQWKRQTSPTGPSGGLGIVKSAWSGFGGLEFAKNAGLATPTEQIIVANRIAFLGYQTKEFRTWKDRVAKKYFYKPSAGIKTWGGRCAKDWFSSNPTWKNRIRHSCKSAKKC